MDKINWLGIIVGSVLGLILPLLFKLLLYIVRRVKKNHIEGVWFWYSRSMIESNYSLTSGTLKIKKGVTKKFIVELRVEGVDRLVYKGTLVHERNCIILKLEGEHQENVTARLFQPIPRKIKIAHGIVLALDYNGNILAAPAIISSKKLSHSIAEKFLLKYSKSNDKKKALSSNP
jgi:hypothetical protein